MNQLLEDLYNKGYVGNVCNNWATLVTKRPLFDTMATSLGRNYNGTNNILQFIRSSV